jgi:copper chaperone for superoxide dismutase
VNEQGEARFRLVDNTVKVWDIIGRGLVITEREDDLGKGSDASSKINGNSGNVLLGGIVARSAGVGQNRKKVKLHVYLEDDFIYRCVLAMIQRSSKYKQSF